MATTGVTFEVKGTPELMHALQKLSDKVAKEITEKAVRAAGQVIADAAIALAPRGETGKLKKSIGVFADVRVGHKNKTTAFVGTELWYGRFVELGTIYQAPQSFLRDAADTNEEQINAAAARVISQGIEEALN